MIEHTGGGRTDPKLRKDTLQSNFISLNVVFNLLYDHHSTNSQSFSPFRFKVIPWRRETNLTSLELLKCRSSRDPPNIRPRPPPEPSFTSRDEDGDGSVKVGVSQVFNRWAPLWLKHFKDNGSTAAKATFLTAASRCPLCGVKFAKDQTCKTFANNGDFIRRHTVEPC